jgi:hypothetical protein
MAQSWTKVTVTGKTKNLDEIVSVMSMLDNGLMIEDYSDFSLNGMYGELVDESILNADREVVKVSLFVSEDRSALCLLQIEAQGCRPVILPALGQDVNEHLLLLCGRERHMVLDLRAVQADILHGTDDYVLRLCFCADSECHPFHMLSLCFYI